MIGYQGSYKKNILFSCIIFIAFFCLVEISSRIFLAIQYESSSYLFYGFLEKPKFQPIKTQEPYADYYKGLPSHNKRYPVNRMGLRGPEIKPKKEGTKRILCLGASTTYGPNLEFSDTYPALLQKKLNQNFGKGKYEVINAGQPGFNLNHIISYVKHEGLLLDPDIVLLLSANNNFKAPGFWFVQINQQNQKRPKEHPLAKSYRSPLDKLRIFVITHTAIGRIGNDISQRGLRKYRAEFDWPGFAQALMSDDNIWEKQYLKNLNILINLLHDSNSRTKIILLEQAVNTINFPCLAKPWEKSWHSLRSFPKLYPNVYTLNLHHAIIKNAKRGTPVWQDKRKDQMDPLHLSKFGNNIMANTIFDFLKSQNW